MKNKKITKKLQKFITSIADVKKIEMEGINADGWFSKTDGSYLTHVGMENDLNYLLKKGISEQIQAPGKDYSVASIGFNPEEQKWYGWSHRAIFGFGVGSECKKGNCGFMPGNKEEFMADVLQFWGDTDMDGDTHKIEPSVKEASQDGKLGCLVEWKYDNKVPHVPSRGKISSMFESYPEEWGKGEWTAKTMKEAKEMAIDFARGVS